MPVISKRKPYRVGRSRTGLGLFATQEIEKGTRILEYFGPLLDCSKPEDDAIENKYLFELNGRWTIDGSVRCNIARYANHACRPNAESDVYPRLRKVYIRAIKAIKPGDEITYDYGTDYFREYLKPIGCLCAHCEKKRKLVRAEARAKKLRAKKRADAKARKLLKDSAMDRPMAGGLAAGNAVIAGSPNGKTANGSSANGHASRSYARANPLRNAGRDANGHTSNGHASNGRATGRKLQPQLAPKPTSIADLKSLYQSPR